MAPSIDPGSVESPGREPCPSGIVPSRSVGLLAAFAGVLRCAELSDLRAAGGRLGPLPGPADDHGGGAGVGRGRSAAHLGVPSVLQPGDLEPRRPGAGAVRPGGGVDPGRAAAVPADRRHAGAQERARGSRWRRCTTTRCCRRRASRSSASATSGWCWRSGCRCRWAGSAASRCRCCSGCTSAPSAAGSATRPRGRPPGPACARQSAAHRRRARARPSWSWPASCSPWSATLGRRSHASTSWSTAPTPAGRSWRTGRRTST